MAQVRMKAEQAARDTAEQATKSNVHFFFPAGRKSDHVANFMIGSQYTKRMLAASRDTLRFYNARIAKDVGYAADLLACRTPSQITDFWCRVASETAHDYADQFERTLSMVFSPEPDSETGSS